LKKQVLSTLVLLAATAAQAKIATVKIEGKNSNIYVSNNDGTGAVLEYSANTNSSHVIEVDLNSTNTKLLIVENYQAKLLDLAANTSTIVDNGANGQVYSADFSPDNSKAVLTVYGNPGRKARILDLTGATAPQDIVINAAGSLAAWLDADTIVYRGSTLTGEDVRVLELTSSLDYEVMNVATQQFGNIESLDTARTKNAVLLSGGCKLSSPGCGTANVYELNLDTLLVSKVASSSNPLMGGAYSDDDSSIFYKESSNAKAGSSFYLQKKVLASGAVQRLTPKAADIRSFDAR
jgi:hypothetical protein